MRASVSFTVPGEPVPQGSMRAFTMKGAGRRVGMEANNAAKLKDYRARVAHEGRLAMEDRDQFLLVGPVEVVAEFVMPRLKGHFGTGRNAGQLKVTAPTFPSVRPDLDKLMRALLDGLAGVVFQEDGQVAVARIRKVYAGVGTGPRTEVMVRCIEEGGK